LLGFDAGYKWAEQHGIDDEDYCPYGDKPFYEGCVAYLGPSGAAFTTDNGMGVPPPLIPMMMTTITDAHVNCGAGFQPRPRIFTTAHDWRPRAVGSGLLVGARDWRNLS